MDQLKEKARCLPLAPGVYIMRDKNNKVIYVGKAKKLKNRVSQYFQDTASHSPKTRIMVSKIDHFDVIVAASEFEALVLECSLIKQYMPKYNILLKDDKGYPYLRLDMKEIYPRITIVSKPANDGASYYGPFGSRGVTHDLLETLRVTLKLPGCNKKLPGEIGKGRPCLNYHMGQCAGWCQKEDPHAYREIMEQARQLLMGNYKKVADEIRNRMLQAAEDLNFEIAASLRDQLNAVEVLGKKQLVTAGTLADTDVIGFASSETQSCFTVLHFSNGNLIDKDFEILSLQEDEKIAVSSLVKHYYLCRGYAPKIILLPFEMEDTDLFSQLLEKEYGKQPKLRVPQRGDNLRLVELAYKNAFEEVQRVTTKEDRILGSVQLLGRTLAIDPPKRIESYDISNISGTDIVASMVVYQDGKPRKSQYKRFKIRDLEDQDDYQSMRQVLSRRFWHYTNGDEGFAESPDLLLIDGGVRHAKIACDVLQEFGLSFPVFGMVKDDRHRTRALVTADGREISIENHPSVFSLVGNIQEETHRFAIQYHRQLRTKRLRYSQLDKIPGIGPKRKQELLKTFKSIAAIKSASISELQRILPKDCAEAVYHYFLENHEE